MSEPVDHRAAAQELLAEAADSPPTAALQDIALLLKFAQVHATLALSAPASSDDGYGEQAGQLEALTAATQELVKAIHATMGPFPGGPIEGALLRVRALVEHES